MLIKCLKVSKLLLPKNVSPIVNKYLFAKKKPITEEEMDEGYRTVDFTTGEEYETFKKTGRILKKIDQVVSQEQAAIIKRSLIIPQGEYKIAYCRSQGPGGQHVNKTDSKAIVNWNVMKSKIINEATKRTILSQYANKINKDGDLIITCQDSREQYNNLATAIDNLKSIISNCHAEEVLREIKFKKECPENEENRIRNKKIHSDKKKRRNSIEF